MVADQRERQFPVRLLIKLSQKFRRIFKNIPDSRMKLSLGRGWMGDVIL